MEPVPGPGQCSLQSFLGAARVDRRIQTAGSHVDWSQEILSSPHPHPHICTHRHVHVCRGIHACAEMWIQMLVPAASATCAHVCTTRGRLKVSQQ